MWRANGTVVLPDVGNASGLKGTAGGACRINTFPGHLPLERPRLTLCRTRWYLYEYVNTKHSARAGNTQKNNKQMPFSLGAHSPVNELSGVRNIPLDSSLAEQTAVHFFKGLAGLFALASATTCRAEAWVSVPHPTAALNSPGSSPARLKGFPLPFRPCFSRLSCPRVLLLLPVALSTMCNYKFICVFICFMSVSRQGPPVVLALFNRSLAEYLSPYWTHRLILNK